MRLYVMRHGAAEDRAPSGRDIDRELTTVGRAAVESIASALLKTHGMAPLRVLVSPARRTHQTAAVVAAKLAAGIAVCDALAVDAEIPLNLVRDLRATGHDTLLVGHQPAVEALVRHLLLPAPFLLPTGFRTATLVALEVNEQERWCVRTILTP